MINKDFYPTPAWVTEKLLSGFNFKNNLNVLEPSAGKGDMAIAFQNQFHEWTRFDRYSIKSLDCIEIDGELQAILRDKGFKVIHDDFLTFDCKKAYDLILANFPFSEGNNHLIKAINIQERFGGELRCIVNASTIKNPCTRLREDIIRKLEKYNAEIEFLENAFVDAERKTSVEVALIKVKMPAVEYKSILLDNLKKKEEGYSHADDVFEMIPSGNEIEQAVLFYQNEISAGLGLIREYYALNKKFGLQLPFGDVKTTEKDAVNNFVECTRDKYWRKLINTSEFFKKMPRAMTDELYQKIEELCNYDFNHFNIVQIQDIMQRNLAVLLSDTILRLFDTLSHKYAYGDGLQNKLHYNGWKTNEAYKVNEKKVILPNIYAYGDMSFNRDKLAVSWSDREVLADIHKSLRFLDTGKAESFDLDSYLREPRDPKNVECPYFVLDFYKKGTCHIKWKRPDLIEKLNIYGSQKKGWLPPAYGNKAYKDMDAEEKAVIDSFQGEDKYNKVCLEKSKYFITNPLTLVAGL